MSRYKDNNSNIQLWRAKSCSQPAAQLHAQWLPVFQPYAGKLGAAAFKQFSLPLSLWPLNMKHMSCDLGSWDNFGVNLKVRNLQSVAPPCCEVLAFYFADMSSLRMWRVFLRSFLAIILYTWLPEFVRWDFSIRKMFPVQRKLLIFLPLSWPGLDWRLFSC